MFAPALEIYVGKSECKISKEKKIAFHFFAAVNFVVITSK